MKKIFTLISVLTFSVAALADRPLGKMVVNNQGRKSIIVELDGRSFRQSSDGFRFDNLEPGFHDLRIYEERDRSPWFGAYGLFRRNPLIYSERLLIRPRTFVEVVVARKGNVFINEQKLFDRDDRRNNGRDDDNWYPKRDYNRGYDPDPNYRVREMDSRSFENLMNTLRRESFEKSRLAMACQLTDGRYFSSRQVLDMVLLFSFDDSKLELAKQAYRNTVDKENFYQVYNAFSFSRSREELAEYIRRFR